MTQDQYDQTRGPGYVVHDDAIPDEENEEYATGQYKPKTAFQKVASALRGDRADRDEADQGQPDPDQAAGNRVVTSSETATGSDTMAPGTDRTNADMSSTDTSGANPPWVTDQDEAAMANSPISQEAQGSTGTTEASAGGTAAATGTDTQRDDYWDQSGTTATDRDEAAAMTNPDVPVPADLSGTDPLTRQDQVTGQADPADVDHPATQPDMFGTNSRAGNGATSAPYPQSQTVPAGAAQTGDVPANGAAATGALADEATGTAGRHAAAAPAGTESRPGEAAGTLGDFSDLSYGSLIADGSVYLEQWQQVQFKFVDDPHASVTEAAEIVAQVTARLAAAIEERQRAIEERQRAIAEQQRSLRGRWGEGSNADTEGLRETLRLYRTFLDQLIGPRAG